MMRKVNAGLTLALSVGMGLAANLPIAADTASDARKSIETAMAKMRVALSKKDAAGYTQFYAEDYVHILKNGQKLTKPQAIALMSQVLQQVKTIKTNQKIEKFVFSKDKVTVHVAENGTMTLPNPRTGKDSKLTSSSLDEAIWLRTANGWKIKQSKTLSSKSLVDGKPVPQR